MPARPVVPLAVALILCATPPLHAQKSPAEAMQERAAYRTLKASLHLTPEQQQKIREIQRKFQPRLDAVRAKYESQLGPLRSQAGSAGGKPASPEMQKKIGAVMKKVDADLAPVLKQRHQEEIKVYTPAQRKLVEAFEKAHPPRP